jgi:inosine-uridine nucleoside N-ribohydrolase
MRAAKRIIKRIIIFILILLAIYLLISNIDFIRDLAGREKTGILIDADAANEGGDVLAIWRMLVEENIEVRGLLSSQWRIADLDNDSTVESNLEIHRQILEHFRLEHIPQSPGRKLPLAYPLPGGGMNEASGTIIKMADEMSHGQKLDVLCLGSATNIAGAILERPDIAGKIAVYTIGPHYNPSRRAWNKNDPVSKLDLDAMDILMNSGQLELHLIPANIASDMILEKSSMYAAMQEKDSLLRSVCNLCPETGTDTLVCSSFALAEAFLYPDMVTVKQLNTPPENLQRKIYVYTRIDTRRMQKDLLRHIANP